ncbi:MAG: nicotinate-nucleotide--dimethylbenzimidazole phosphoribosyltransferase [Clostridia bacterium]|nr:nicotinate-nucleotide--dimethylbenzimidazole phosphoribosyltransferase [Clostridia bacterium]
MINIDVKPLSPEAEKAARARWDNVAKPLSSMGRFEDMICRIAAVQGTAEVELRPRCALVFCGDHGVVNQGVSQSDSSVTALVAASVARGESNINVLASCCGTDVYAVDMGMKTPVNDPRIIDLSCGSGTNDLSLMPAMSRKTAEDALLKGARLIKSFASKGYRLFATGEMGIGNTTASAALTCALTGLEVHEAVCRGSGLSDEGLRCKEEVICRALKLHKPDPADPIGALAALGGFEIAGMAGAFLGAAECGVNIVIDGVISSVAALAAARICPDAVSYMLASHMSASKAMKPVMDELGLKPVIQGKMALGEGTGAVMLFPLLDMAKALYDSAHDFASLGMEAYKPL